MYIYFYLSTSIYIYLYLSIFLSIHTGLTPRPGADEDAFADDALAGGGGAAEEEVRARAARLGGARR